MAPRVARGPNTRPQPSGAAAGQEAEPGFPLDPFGVLNSQARQEETQPHVDRDRGEPLCTQPSQPRPEPAPCAAIPGSNVHITATAAPRSPWNPPEAFFSQALLPHQTPAFPVLSTHPAAPAHSVHLPNPAHPAYVYEPLLFSPPPPWPPCRPPAPQRLQQSPLARKPGLGGARAASVSPPAGQLRRGSPRLSRPPLAWASTQRAGPSHHQGAFPSSSTGSTPLRKGPDLSPSRSGPPQAKDLPRLKAAVAVLRGSIEALFPTLHPLLPTWLLWQLMAQQGTAQRVGRLGADDQGTEDESSKAATGGEWLTAGQLVLSPGRAGQTLRALSLLSHAELAGLCQLVLEGLRSEFLEGRSLEGGVLEVLVAAPHTRTPDTLLKPLGDSPINPADVAAAALHLVAAPAALTPQLPSPGGSSGGTAPLPPPPPQAPAAQLAADPPPGLRLFTEDSPQLRSLVAAALERWEATARLAHAVHDTAAQRSAGRSQQAADGLSSGGGCEVVVGPGVDFGLRQVTPASEQLQQVLGGGFGGKRGPPNGAHVEVAMEGGASLLDLLHLLTEGAGAAGEGARGAERGGEGGSAVAGQEGSGPVGSAQVGSRDGWPGVPAGAAPSLPAPPLLSFRSIEISNKSSSSIGGKGSGDLWVLGGLASPQLPHTFAVLDDGRLFVAEGHMAVRIPPGASHPLTAALSTTDGPHRTEECGLLKQLLLVVLAVPLPSPTAAHLASLGGAVPWEDVVGEVGGQGESGGGGEGGREGSLPPAGMRGWRVFVVGRQLTVGLVRRAGEVARLLDPEARPYVAESLRTLFNTPPPRFMGGRTAVHAQLTLEDPLPASQQLGLAVARWAAAVAGGGGARQSRLERGEGDWLTAKYRRLLLLEEQAMEQGMGRYDMWYTRLRLAAVREDPKQPPGSGSFRYSEILDGDPRESGGGGSRRRGVYIGPLPPPHDAGGALRLLGMLDVPGLQEGRPTLVAGDTVYLRTAGDPYREIPAVLLLAQGSLCFLALPPLFWDSQDVRPLLEGVVGGTGRKAVGAAGGAWQGGLCHVRFSFDRRPLAMMHAALMVASAAMSAHDRRSTLPACRLLPPSPPQGDTSPSLDKAFSSGVECQPPTAWLVPAAEAFEERGGQRLNAEQRAAVAAVVGGGGRAAPFALFGPPGTGKTVTLVECALQLLAAHPACRLLLAAPQNYSADLLCSALAAAGVGPDTMCRLNDPRRPAPQVKADVVPYCWFSPETRLHVVPSPLILQRYAVVVCTCTAAGLLQGQTFTHVLVDEAGQALVPEALIPLALLHPPSPPAPTAPLTTSPVASAVSPTAAPPPPSLEQAAAARSIREATTSSTLHIEHVPHGSSSSSSSGVGGCGGSTPAPSKASAGDPGSPAEKFPPQWGAEVPQAWRHLAWPWDLLDREASTAHAEGGEYSCPRESQAPGDGGAAVSLGWGAVLCGDPQQLGPVVHSGTAAAVGLGVSLLEQWIRFHGSTSSLYEAQRVSPPLIQLVRNYRSHPRLLTLPSRLFYRGTLQAAAHPASVEAPAWQELRCVTPPPGTIPYATRGQGQSQEGTHTSAGFAPVHEQTADSASGSSNDSSHEQAAAPPHAHSALRGSAAGGSHGREGGWEGYGSDGGAAPPLANLLFWGVMGQQAREGEAPSFFNPMEASVVVELVQGLLGAGSGVGPDDIGVMATYRKQVQKVRLLLREKGLGAIRVGTVDDYQGQEERIIFITTVLSKPESLPPLHSATAMAVTTLQQSSTSAGGVGPMLGRDAVAGGAVEGAATEAGAAHAPTDLHLGFWRNPKRFNVAITRARAVLVVVGHPLVLLQDANWRELLSYCVGRGVYRGAGAGMIRERLGVGTNDGEPDHDDHDDPGGADGGAGGGEELRRFIREVADRALLGVGDADVMFPTTLDQMYEAYADDVPGRIML